jgi:serine/threonine-protein kinase
MKESWYWIGKYLVVIVVALVLGSVLAGIEPFRSTTLGSVRIGAGTLVQFIAHSGALALLWAMGLRHSAQLRRSGGATAPLAKMVLSLVTLIVAASFYAVLSRFIAPLLSSELKSVVDWSFIVAILAAALWLLWVLFADTEALIAAFGSVAARRRRAAAPPGAPAGTKSA